jgi:DNA-binding PadR family transcriptional regulator
MHPYQMQKLLRERHKDELLVLKRGSLYHAIHRLERSTLIEAVRTVRHGNRPERTTYRITASGRKELLRWLRQMIGVPRRESSDFMAALSFLPLLTVEEAARGLEERSGALEAEIAELAARMEAVSTWVDRVRLIESEYLRAMRKAEFEWVHRLESELRSRKLTWNLQTIFKSIRVVKMRTEAGSATAAGVGKSRKKARQ